MSNYSSPYLDSNPLTSSPVASSRNTATSGTLNYHHSSTNWNGISEDSSPATNSSSNSTNNNSNSNKTAVTPFQTYPKRDGITIDASLGKTDLMGLDMSGFRIKRLPIELFHFGFMMELRLANNFLTNLPSEIGLLRTLTSLDLSNNQLTSLPRELAKLTNLTELLVYNNQLTQLPSEFGYLYQCQTLGIEGNPIMEPILSILHSQGSSYIIPFLRDHMISKHWRLVQVIILITNLFIIFTSLQILIPRWKDFGTLWTSTLTWILATHSPC